MANALRQMPSQLSDSSNGLGGGRSMGITMFTPAPFPSNENQRSKAASDSGLINRSNDSRLLKIVHETQIALNSSWCGITIMIGDKQHVIASTGGRLGSHRRSTSLCSYVISDPSSAFFVLDAASDARFAGNPFVEDGIIRFFAGSPIFDGARLAVGALCVTDNMPRQSFLEEGMAVLKQYAAAITEII